MINFFWKKSKLKVTVETELNNWHKTKTEEDIISDMKWTINRKIEELVIEQVKFEVDKLALEGLAKKLIEEYDFDAPIKAHMHKVVQDYLEGTREQAKRIGRY